MDVGRMNKRVTICKYKDTESELLQTEQKIIEIKQVWASVEPVRGREFYEEQRINQETTYKITMRFHEEIETDRIIKFKEKIFKIISVINVREQNKMLELLCTLDSRDNAASSEKEGIFEEF